MLDLALNEMTYIVATTISLFVMVDPFAVIPVYLTLTEKMSHAERSHVRFKASLVALGILMLFALTGMAVFQVFGITIPAFRIAGGILLLKLGMEQLGGDRTRVKPEEEEESLERDDISIFPLATPLLAGPGAISTVVLYASRAPSTVRVVSLALSIIVALGVTHVILKFSPYVVKYLGRTGLNLMTRIMGIILCAVGVQFIIDGLRGALGL